MKHKHHIIPRHMGGTDDPSNLIELTIEDHAEAHRKLYEEHGNEFDRIAYEALSKQIGKEEILTQVLSESGKKSGMNDKEAKRKIGRARGLANKGRVPWNKGIPMRETEKLKRSNTLKKMIEDGTWTPNRKGVKLTEEIKEKMSVSARSRVTK